MRRISKPAHKSFVLALTMILVIGSLFTTMIFKTTSQAVTSNVLVNGGFENGTTGWTISSTPSALGTLNTTGTARTGSGHLNYWHGESFELSATQQVTGLSDGVYELVGYSVGDWGKTFPIIVSATTTEAGVGLSQTVTNTAWDTWKEVKIGNIEVRDGYCNVQILVQGGAGDWGGFDDFSLMQTGPLPDEVVTITSIEPVNQPNALINAVPLLPAKVTVNYDNQTQGLANVTWAAITLAQYGNVGTFQVEGDVEGTTIKAIATISEGYRNQDVNGDDVIDLLDLAEVSYYYGAKTGDANWSGATLKDINNDKVINDWDLEKIMDSMSAHQ